MTATPSIVLGPPGTGKTTTLLKMVEDQISRGVRPSQMGFVSFTRKAAHEAVGRAVDKFELAKDEFPFFSTIHALCYRQLGMSSGMLLEGKKLEEFSRYVGYRITGRLTEDGVWSTGDIGDRMMMLENRSRIEMRDLQEIHSKETDNVVQWHALREFARKLKEFKQDNHLKDFTDMLKEFVTDGPRLGLKVLFVDETQDLSRLQWAVIEKLAADAEIYAVAGDDDQAIYRWAGADVDTLIDMRGNVRVLGQSWRVPPAIQSIAHDIISGVRHRRPKEWKARTGEDGKVQDLREFDPAVVTDADASTLLLCRNVYVMKEQLEPELRRAGVIYERNDHPSIKMSVMDAIRTWEALRAGKTIRTADARVIYDWMSAGRGYKKGNKKLPQLHDEEPVSMIDMQILGGLQTEAPWFEALDKIEGVGKLAPGFTEADYIRAALRRAQGKFPQGRPTVKVSTIHGAKGGEADHVVLMKEMAWRSFREMHQNPEDERRVWYVGVTRAKRRLTIIESGNGRTCPWL